MTPAEAIALLDLLLSAADHVSTYVDQRNDAGVVSPERQKMVRDKIEAIRARIAKNGAL